jgi:hypothetical protein
MYVPGFNPYLESTFGGMAPTPDFYGVTSPEQFGTPGFAQWNEFNSLVQDPSRMVGGETYAGSFGMQPTLSGAGPESEREGAVFYGRDGNVVDFVAANPDGQFRLIDRTTGQEVGSGTGNDALLGLRTQARDLSNTGGSNSNWVVETLNPRTNTWDTVAKETPKVSAPGIFADFALPVLGATLLPGVGGFLGGALGSGLGAAGGSLASSALQGRPLDQALVQAALTGGGAGLAAGATSGLGSLGGAGGGSTGGAVGGAAGSTAGAGGGALGNIVVSASSLTPALAGTLGAGLGGLTGALSGMAPGTGSNLGNQVFQQPQDAAVTPPEGFGNNITVTGSSPTPAAAGGLGAGVVGGGGNVFNDAFGGNQIIAEASRPPTPQGDPAAPPIIPLPIPLGGAPAAGGNEIVVTGQTANDPNLLENMAPVVLGGGALAGLAGSSPPMTPENTTQPKSTLDKITDILQAGGLGIGVLGNLFGGGGGNQQPNLVPGGLGGMGQLRPVFGSQLPAPSMGSLNQRAVTDDWNTYGYRPERSFFDYVPQNPVGPMAPFTQNQLPQNQLPQPTGPSQPPMGIVPDNMVFAEGGEVDAFAVRGPGTGRSDEIPALLSDGEYVIDAETVALLGDGSSEAGANRLDQMREAVRRHKGQQLAKGKFSPDAKAPEQYLLGGRT